MARYSTLVAGLKGKMQKILMFQRGAIVMALSFYYSRMEAVFEWIKETLVSGDQHALIFALCMGVMLFAPMLAGRFRIPGLVGLLVAGMLLGQNGFQVIEYDTFIERLGTIGLIFILGLAGLELDLHEFLSPPLGIASLWMY